MEENKAVFIDALSYALRNYTRLGIASMEYIPPQYRGGTELVKIGFNSGSTINVNVTADSCLAMMKDICKALS